MFLSDGCTACSFTQSSMSTNKAQRTRIPYVGMLKQMTRVVCVEDELELAASTLKPVI